MQMSVWCSSMKVLQYWFLNCDLVMIDISSCFFGFKRHKSFINILLLLGLPSFDTLLANVAVSLNNIWNACTNSIALCVICILKVWICHCDFSFVFLALCVFTFWCVWFSLLCLHVSAYIFLLFLLFLWSMLPEIKSMLCYVIKLNETSSFKIQLYASETNEYIVYRTN